MFYSHLNRSIFFLLISMVIFIILYYDRIINYKQVLSRTNEFPEGWMRFYLGRQDDFISFLMECL